MLFRRSLAYLVAFSATATAVFPAPHSSHHGSGGSGPFPATYLTDPSLPRHTIYIPESPELPPWVSLPVLVWAEGGCGNNGTSFEPFLTNIASYGFIVLALGPPNGTGYIFQDAMDDAVTWVQERAGKLGRYENVDSSRIAAAGQSCGGLLAYTQRHNDAVSFLGIFNSGLLGNTTDAQENLPKGMIIEEPSVIHEVKKPVFWWLGGSEDVAQSAGTADYHNLTRVPKWIGNYPVGHSGTYQEPDGGEFGVAAVNWLRWVLKGDKQASKFFRSGGAERAGWVETESWGLERLDLYSEQDID
ncbi:alpha/beta hydrolase family protein [Aspergillus lucknowensis]|uniref:Alpha/Beta hydrolase protein n=1 Tax=Aspergillus lucknowensis TaxID=176173 RepID=A0ABR4LGY2_9EURO